MLCPLRLDIDPLPSDSAWLLDETAVREHCRVDHTDDDSLLQAYLSSAVLWAENLTHRTIIQREHRWVLREFPYCDPFQKIKLPRGKTQSVTTVEYSLNGTIATLTGPSSDSTPAGTDFLEDLRGEDGGIIMPLRGSTWPTTDLDVPAPVTITFQSGWASDDIPRDLFNAVLIAVEDAYDMRGTADETQISESGKKLAARMALVSGYQLVRWY